MGGAPTACVPHHCPELAMGALFSEGPEAPGLPGPRVPGPVSRTLCCRAVDLAFSGLRGCPRGHPWGHWAGQRTQDPKHSFHSFMVEPPAGRPLCPEPRRLQTVTPHPRGVPGAHTPCLAAEAGRDHPGAQHRGESCAQLSAPSQEPGQLRGRPKVGGGRRGRGSLSQQHARSHPGPGVSPQDGPEDRPAGWRARLKPVEKKSPADRCVRRAPRRRPASPACGQGGHTAGASHRPATGRPLGTHSRAVCRRPVWVSCGSRSLRGQATCPQALNSRGSDGSRESPPAPGSSLNQPGGPGE